MRKRTQARECALKILYQVDMIEQPLAQALTAFWDFQPAPEEIREFAERLVRGTLEHLSEIDQKIEKYTENWELKRMAVVDRNILRFSVYELLFMDEIPPKVTINEAVNIAKKYSQDEAGKFVNGILDKINHTEVHKPDQTSSPHEETNT
ncbi:MAG: transcription antitermination factor NusB [Candidatus Omnitrophica bacterium]|nr:transcription antitermination factor NusB [Candidatus Omnitrophota bacterium]